MTFKIICLTVLSSIAIMSFSAASASSSVYTIKITNNSALKHNLNVAVKQSCHREYYKSLKPTGLCGSHHSDWTYNYSKSVKLIPYSSTPKTVQFTTDRCKKNTDGYVKTNYGILRYVQIFTCIPSFTSPKNCIEICGQRITIHSTGNQYYFSGPQLSVTINADGQCTVKTTSATNQSQATQGITSGYKGCK